MKKKAARTVLQALSAAVILSGAGSVSAQVTTTEAGRIEQTFVSTDSGPAELSDLSGAFQPLESLAVNLKSDSTLIITYTARGTVAPGDAIPIVFVKCEFDGTPCEPNANPIEFLYPQFCCDSRSYSWIVHAAPRGSHNVAILWSMGNPTLAIVTNRTLVVQAARR
jgi:hypothetical protein